MFRAVIFDFNGVLVDDEPIHLRLFREVLAEEGIELSAEDYYAHYLGFDDRGCFEAVLKAAGETPTTSRVVRLIARKSSYYQDLVRREGYPFFPGAITLVRALADANVPLGLVSGALRDEIEGALAQEGLLQCFKVLVTAEDVALGKPDPEGYRRGLDELNATPPLPHRLLHPHEVVAIEDSPAGIAAARGAGLATLGVAQTYPLAELGSADRAVLRVADLTVAQVLGE
ncbi:MAG: HAD family phosphatase [Thermoanaerobaculia bacterium]|nr:HAD family phosphatase [Thermoanaerobaculia bacterium]